MRDIAELENTLRRLEGRSYKAYREIEGSYRFADGILSIDHVQGDPFAAPSRLRVSLDGQRAGWPEALFGNRIRRFALTDFLARNVKAAIAGRSGRAGSGKSGLILIDSGGQEALERTAVIIDEEKVEARIEAGLPAAGRRILGYRAVEMLCRDLPVIGKTGLAWTREVEARARQWVTCVENQEAIRDQLDKKELVAFIREGSILPRLSGVSDRPLTGEAVVPFRSPEGLRVDLSIPNTIEGEEGGGGTVSGMGIPKGVTLIAGGGYHGKSTLLRTLERCVYPHIPGDGREFSATEPNAVKIRAEDRRRLEKVDISAFINHLPSGQSTTAFCTEEASGSTSQAGGIMEAVEAGARTLLIDEDTSATNFMVRDARMRQLVSAEDEPITPLLDRIRQLYQSRGVSTVLVMGGSGDYFDVADTVIVMRNYRARNAGLEAKEIVQIIPADRPMETGEGFPPFRERSPQKESLDPSRGKRSVKIDAPDFQTIRFGNETIDLRAVEQFIDRSQTRAAGYALYLASQRFMRSGETMQTVLDRLENYLDAEGLDALDPWFREGKKTREHPGNFARPRRHEIAAALNRLRSLRVGQV